MTYLSEIHTRTILLGLVITNCGPSYCIMCHTGLFTMHYALWSNFTLPHSGIWKILCSMRFMHYDHMHYEIMYCNTTSRLLRQTQRTRVCAMSFRGRRTASAKYSHIQQVERPSWPSQDLITLFTALNSWQSPNHHPCTRSPSFFWGPSGYGRR